MKEHGHFWCGMTLIGGLHIQKKICSVNVTLEKGMTHMTGYKYKAIVTSFYKSPTCSPSSHIRLFGLH
jgi:hypothetical protein